jgi:subfamily B ATP-binding cassette protein MsbA
MQALARLKPYLRPYIWLIVGSALLAIPLAALRLGPAPLAKYAIDQLMIQKNPHLLLWLPLMIAGMGILNFPVRFFHYYLLRIVIARVDQRLKNELFEHLLGLSADYFTAQSTGSLISRVGSDPQYISGGIAQINVLAREPLTLIGCFGYAIYLNWRLTIVTLVVIPPLAWVFSGTARNLKRYIHRMQETNALLFSTLQESFTGVRVVKMFKLEKYVYKKFRERSELFTKFLLKSAVLEEASHPAIELFSYVAAGGLVYFGGKQIFSGKMSPGDFVGFLVAFGMMMNPIRVMNDVNLKLTAAAAACKRIFDVFDWKTHIDDSESSRSVKSFERDIHFNQVSFAYPDAPGRDILKSVDFTVKRGEVVAIVGASGAGKSSIVSLLPRVFDVTGGQIEIDGVDIKKYKIEDLRNLIAVVSQDVFLFNDTIEQNIRCGRLSASHEEVLAAAQKAHAEEFIKTTPEGYQSIIGDRGQKLSGGERQRISIARAFLRAAPILILDEATSSLDSTSERIVQTALEDLMKDRTTLVIAHRLSTIQNADHILVLKEGKIVERGRHADLLKMNGEYSLFHGLSSGGVSRS